MKSENGSYELLFHYYKEEVTLTANSKKTIITVIILFREDKDEDQNCRTGHNERVR